MGVDSEVYIIPLKADFKPEIQQMLELFELMKRKSVISDNVASFIATDEMREPYNGNNFTDIINKLKSDEFKVNGYNIHIPWIPDDFRNRLLTKQHIDSNSVFEGITIGVGSKSSYDINGDLEFQTNFYICFSFRPGFALHFNEYISELVSDEFFNEFLSKLSNIMGIRFKLKTHVSM
jgi:hypothetical protein